MFETPFSSDSSSLKFVVDTVRFADAAGITSTSVVMLLEYLSHFSVVTLLEYLRHFSVVMLLEYLGKSSVVIVFKYLGHSSVHVR